MRPRRSSMSRAVGIRPSSSPSSRSWATSSSRLMKRRGVRPAARFAAFQVPKCSITVCGCTRRLRIGCELPHRRRPAETCGGRAQLGEDLLVRVAAAQARAKRGERLLVDALERRMTATGPCHAIILDHLPMICKRGPSGPRDVGTLGADERATRPRDVRRPCSSAGSPARPGRGGGTTLPGKLVWKLDPGAIDALAGRLAAGGRARLRDEREDHDDRDGRVDSLPHAPARLEPLRCEPRVGRRLHPARSARRGAGPARGRRVRAAGDHAAHAAACRVPRRTCFATSSTATASSSTSPSAGATRSPRSPATPRSSSTPTTRSSPRSPTVASMRCASASTTRALRARSLQHAADSKYCVRCGAPYEYAAAYVGHLGDYRVRELRARAAAARRRSARDRAGRARRGLVHARDPRRERRASGSPLPGLYNVYNALAAASLALALGVDARRDRGRGSRALPCRVRAVRAHRRPATAAC